MNYTITEVFLDLSNHYRVRVIIDENNSQFFYFDHYPTQAEVNSVVESFVSRIVPDNGVI